MNDSPDATKRVPVYGQDIPRLAQPKGKQETPPLGPVAKWIARIIAIILTIAVVSILAMVSFWSVITVYKALFN